MNVLMFGWEFPPHISGGLGTACYGIVKGLSMINDVHVHFVVPKAVGIENTEHFQLINAENISVSKELFTTEFTHSLHCFEIPCNLVPYLRPEEYQNQQRFTVENIGKIFNIDEQGKMRFTGTYGADLYEEISKYALVAKSIAQNTQFDVIHAHDWLTFPAGVVTKEISGKPLVVHVHATDFDRSGGSVNPRVFSIEKEGMEKADRIITVSNHTRNIVIGQYGIQPEKIITVYNAVESIPYDQVQACSKRNKEKTITFLGRITMQKGPEFFIEVAKLLLQKMKNIRFIMAGSGDRMDEMIKLTARYHISDKFHFTGFLKGNDVKKILGSSDVFVMPSISEPFGIAPLEAMQLKVPVIISNQSGVSEVLKNAIKTDFWDIHAIADAIHGILKHKSLSGMLVREGLAEVKLMKWENTSRQIFNIYRDVLKYN